MEIQSNFPNFILNFVWWFYDCNTVCYQWDGTMLLWTFQALLEEWDDEDEKCDDENAGERRHRRRRSDKRLAEGLHARINMLQS